MNQAPDSALPALPAALACCDADLRLTFLDPAFARQLALPEAASGRIATELPAAAGSGAARWLAALHQVRQTGTAASLSWPGAGPDFHWELEVWPQRDEARVTGLTSVLRNVQDRHQTATDLARVTNHLESFVYTAAHDLQAPVGNLQVLLHMLLEHPHDPDTQLLLDHVQQSVQQLEATIAGLVEVLEVQSTFRVPVQELEPAAVCAEVLQELQQNAGAELNNVEIVFSDLPRLHYSRHYLRSLFHNLLGNARKYGPADRPLRLRVWGWREPDFAVIAVQDNGIGIDLERYGHKLFQPFSRLSTDTEGKGLGLYLLHNMLQRNGGRIEVASQPGAGTVFTCYLREYSL